MAHLSCTFHKRAPARWRCIKCKTSYCPDCVQGGYMLQHQHDCPLCKMELTYVAYKQHIPPIHQRWRKIFSYPFNYASRSFLFWFLFVSMAGTQMNVSGLFFVGAILGGIGQVVQLGVLFFIVSCGYLALHHTARGFMDASSLSEVYAEKVTSTLFRMIGIVILQVILIVVILIFFGWVTAIVLLALIFCWFPASIMMVVLSDSLLRAFNPIVLIKLISKLGVSYVFLYAVSLVMFAAFVLALGVIHERSSDLIFGLAHNLGFFYVTMVTFHMMGYVIYQHHEALGFHPKLDFNIKGESGDQKKEVLIDTLIYQSNILKKNNRLKDAIYLLQSRARHSNNAKLHEHLCDLLIQYGDKEQILNSVPAYMDLIVSSSVKNKSLLFMKKMFDVVPDYYPDPELAYTLITIAYQEEDYHMVVKLASHFSQLYGEDNHVFDVDFYAAKSFAELGNIKAGLDICIDLESRFPGHKRASDVQRQGKLLSRRFKWKENS